MRPVPVPGCGHVHDVPPPRETANDVNAFPNDSRPATNGALSGSAMLKWRGSAVKAASREGRFITHAAAAPQSVQSRERPRAPMPDELVNA